MKLRWTERARRDLLEIGSYIGRDNPEVARRWVETLRDLARKAAAKPGMGRVVPEFQRTDVREVLLRSYRVVYRLREDAVEVLTVFEGHRLLDRTTLAHNEPE